MSLYSTPEWRAQLRQFLERRSWNNVRWAAELNRRPTGNNRSLCLTDEGLSRWLNNGQQSAEYRGPKHRDDYVAIAHALIQLQIISPVEACTWLLMQGLYPLPQEVVLFATARMSASDE